MPTVRPLVLAALLTLSCAPAVGLARGLPDSAPPHATHGPASIHGERGPHATDRPEAYAKHGRHPRWNPAPRAHPLPHGLPPGARHPHPYHEPRYDHWRDSWYHGWNGTRYRAAVRYHYPQGYARYHWRVRHTLPAAFLVPVWYVDHRPYRLAPPPYGCRWVRVDHDLLLVELATGLIVDVLYDFYY